MRTWWLLLGLLMATPAWADEASNPAEVAVPPGPVGLTGPLTARYDALTSAALDRDAAVSLKDVTVESPALRWRLVQGTFVPLRLPGGETLGGWFAGECTVTYTPPLGQEADALERWTGRPTLDGTECDEGFILSDDPALLATLVPPESPSAKAPPESGDLRRLLKGSRLRSDPKRGWSGFAVDALARVVEGGGAGRVRLSVSVEGPGGPSWVEGVGGMESFTYDRHPRGGMAPSETISTTGGRRTEGTSPGWGARITSHAEDAAPSASGVDLLAAELTLDIQAEPVAQFAEMTATADLVWTASGRSAPGVVLGLLHRGSFARRIEVQEPLGFDVSEVRDGQGRALPFLHVGSSLLVRMSEPVAVGTEARLTVVYAGNAMPRVGENSFGLLANYAWWPQPRMGDRFRWAVNLCVPETFLVAGTGTTMESTVSDGRRCERWTEDKPILFPAINMGRWKTAEAVGPRGTKVRAFFLAANADAMQPALQEIVRGLEFYEDLYGPYPYAELDIAQAQRNMGFWQAPAGLIELSASEGAVLSTFTKDLPSDFYPHQSSATLVHELAHQWWGHVVGWASYRDQWVSETFSEYASLLYMAQYYGAESYFGRLEWWEHMARETDPFGPVVLGSRLGRGRVGQFYARGPYVLHLLRGVVGDEAFRAWMRTVVDVVAHRNLATEDLFLITEKVLGPAARPFFERWLLETGLPDLELTWSKEGGDVVVTLKQTQPEEAYPLGVTIALDGRGKVSQSHLVPLSERSTTVILPGPPGGVRGVRIDPEFDLLTGKKDVKKR